MAFDQRPLDVTWDDIRLAPRKTALSRRPITIAMFVFILIGFFGISALRPGNQPVAPDHVAQPAAEPLTVVKKAALAVVVGVRKKQKEIPICERLNQWQDTVSFRLGRVTADGCALTGRGR